MERVILNISHGLHNVSKAILAFMAVLVTLDVIGRWIFHTPITGGVEMIGQGLSLVIFLSLGLTHIKKEHITIDFLVERFSIRTQRMVDCLVNIIIALLMLAVSISIYQYASRLFHSHTITGDLGIPISIFAFIASVGCLFFALAAILEALLNAQKAVGKHES